MKKTVFSLLPGLLLACMLSACGDNPNQGLTAHYYNNPYWELEPVKTKKVNNIDFVWYGDNEKPLFPPFGIVFEGQIHIPESGNVTFFLSSDDGSTLHLNGELLIDNSGYHANIEKSATKFLEKGWYDLVVHYNELEGGSEVHLSWALPGGEREIVSSRFLRPKSAAPSGDEKSGPASKP